MATSDRSNDEFRSTASSPPASPGTSSSAAGTEGGIAPALSGADHWMPSSNAHETEGNPNPRPGDDNVKESFRHDSTTNLWKDDVYYTVESTDRFRSSFSFEGQSPEGNERQQSVISPSAQRPDETPITPPAATSLPWTTWLVWLHQSILDLSNTVYPPKARRAWEWCDYESTPLKVRQTCQNVLTKQWTRQIPLQYDSPAITACEQLTRVIDEVSQLDKRELEVFEFCAGSGGPTPVFEQKINESRTKSGASPLRFCISDLHPNPAAWKEHTSKSEHLRVIEESVNAIDPPAYARRYSSSPRLSWSCRGTCFRLCILIISQRPLHRKRKTYLSVVQSLLPSFR
jgi:hypothetical protein